MTKNLNKIKHYPSLALCIAILFTAYTPFAFGSNESPQKPRNQKPTYLQSLMPQADKILRDGLDDQNPQIRANAIEVVAVTRRSKLMPKVQRLLKDDFVPVRFAAALAVGDTEYKLAEKSLRPLLNAQEQNTRIAAAYALVKLGYRENLEIIRKAIKSKDQTLRANAALLLGKSGDRSSLELLRMAQQDENSSIRVKLQTLEARARLGDEDIFKKLWAIVFSSYADDRVIGIKAMGALGTQKARDVLITKLDDELLEVRLAAAEQLGMLGDTTGAPEVLDVFNKKLTAKMNNKQDVWRVKTLAALAIGRIGTKPLTRHLAELLQSQSKLVRLAAAKAVFQQTMK